MFRVSKIQIILYRWCDVCKKLFGGVIWQRFWGGQQYTLADSAILVAIGFIGCDADVGEALVSDADLLLAEVVAQCFDATEVVVFSTEFEMNNGAFLFVCCHNSLILTSKV